MKRIILVSVVLLLIAAALPALLAPDSVSATAPDKSPAVTALPAAGLSWQPESDEKKTLTGLDGDKTEKMTMHDYLIGVVAAEMPVKFEPEALKAQAVAARTYTVYGMLTGNKHDNADVCTDSACCQAWRSTDNMKTSWGDSFESNFEKITAAVEATDGQYLIYQGQPILAAFHSSSGGRTENSADAWAGSRDYLVSVTSPETEKDVPNFTSTVTSSPLDFRDTILSKHPEADFTGKRTAWIGKITKDAAGRVKTAVLGGVEIAGTELRELFGLRSTEFKLEYDGADFVFTVTGYGHGVGMSQYGANVMAGNGAKYEAILSHYFPGIELKKA